MQLLEQVFGSKNNIKVLRHLARHENWEFNITELSKDLIINKGILSRLIKKLKENNLINLNQKGKILLFKINKDNLLIKNFIIPIFKLEENLFDDLIKPKLLGLKSDNILSIILYGSYSSGNFKLNSDIDILIVVKNKINLDDRINELKKFFLENDLLLRIDVMSSKEFKQLSKIKEPLIVSIEKNHKILYGKNLDELL